MYKKYLFEYKMHKNDHRNALPICIEGETLQEIEAKRKEAVAKFKLPDRGSRLTRKTSSLILTNSI